MWVDCLAVDLTRQGHFFRLTVLVLTARTMWVDCLAVDLTSQDSLFRLSTLVLLWGVP